MLTSAELSKLIKKTATFSVAGMVAVTALLFTSNIAEAKAKTEANPAIAGEEAAQADEEAPVAVLAGALELLPERIREVDASSRTLAQLTSELEHLEESILHNREIRDVSIDELVRLKDQRERQRADLGQANSKQLEASFRIERHRGELRSLAISAYVGGSQNGEFLIDDAAKANIAGSDAVIIGQVEATVRRNLGQAQTDFGTATRQIRETETALRLTLIEITDTQAQLVAAVAELERLEPQIPRVQEQYRDAFMLATVNGADFSVVALDAYVNATELVPNCRISWTVLAGIGRVESYHGTFGRSQPRANGVVSPRIIGIALDGSEGIALIGDTDGGRLDGDTTFDRAVGPMQFIPSTWRAWSRDGNGDGVRDPHNLYDAAAAAAAYLCKSSLYLDSQANLRRAILTYNQSDTYVNTVFTHHNAYRRLNIAEGN